MPELGNYGSVGWDLPEDDGSSGEGGGRFTSEETLYRFRFRMEDAAKNPIIKGRPVRHRVLFLNGEPFKSFEHSLYKLHNRMGHFTSPCLRRNKLDKRGCPLCEHHNKPYFIGMFGVIDLGQVEFGPKQEIKLHHRTWTNRNGEVMVNAFPRLILGAKLGSQENPGVLKTLLWEAEERGNDFEGTIWDTTRKASKDAAVGTEWDYIDRIAPEEYVNYLEKYGADPEKLDIEPITNWGEICKPLPYEQLAQMVGMESSASNSSERSSGFEGASYGGAPYSDDDIPF